MYTTADTVIISAILAMGVLLSIVTCKLTTAGAITGGVLGWLIFAGSGYTGIVILATFFMLGNLATSHKMEAKKTLHVSEGEHGKRTAGQVVANAGVAGLVGLLVLLLPQLSDLAPLLIAASFASATADTLSSELGNVYGSTFYNIRTFKKDTRGLNGVISMQGTLIGVAGSCLIALIYSVAFGFGIHFVFIVIAGTLGNFADSYLGATLERKGRLGNNAVNFLNTLVAALAAMLFYYVL